MGNQDKFWAGPVVFKAWRFRGGCEAVVRKRHKIESLYLHCSLLTTQSLRGQYGNWTEKMQEARRAERCWVAKIFYCILM